MLGRGRLPGLNQDLPPHLDTTGHAYTAVGTTLTAYANTLSGLPTLRLYFERKVEACTGASWDEVAERLARFAYWEFEDYQP